LFFTKNIKAQIEKRHNITLTKQQADFMDMMFGRYIRPDWKMYDFDWGIRIALKLFPNERTPVFEPEPPYEQIELHG